MRKLLISATVLSFASATMLSAGNLAEFEEPPAAPAAEEPMGGSNAAWLIPLLLIAGAVAIASSGNGNGGGNGATNGTGNGATNGTANGAAATSE